MCAGTIYLSCSPHTSYYVCVGIPTLRCCVQPHRRFVAGEVVVWQDAEGVLRYGVVVDVGRPPAEADSSSHTPLLNRLQVRVSGSEVRGMLSSDVMSFKPTACANTHMSTTPPPPYAEQSAVEGEGGGGGSRSEEGRMPKGDAGVSLAASQQAARGRGASRGMVGGAMGGGGEGRDAVSAQELAGAVERLLSRMDVPLSLDKKQLLESVLVLNSMRAIYAPNVLNLLDSRLVC